MSDPGAGARAQILAYLEPFDDAARRLVTGTGNARWGAARVLLGQWPRPQLLSPTTQDGGSAHPLGGEAVATEVRLAGESEAPVPWPIPPTEEQARHALRAWLTRTPKKRKIPPGIFDVPLRIRDVSRWRVRLVRLVEQRSEQDVDGRRQPIPEAPYVYESSIEDVDLPPPASLEEGRWTLARNDSLRETRCSVCAGRGEARCDKCGGRGHSSCLRCLGTGRIGDGQGGKKDCWACGGRGQWDCGACANGWVACATCSGSGTQITFLQGTIERRREETASTSQARSDPAAEDKSFAVVWQGKGKEPPSGLPTDAADAYRGLVSAADQECLAHRMDVEVARITQVDFDVEGRGAHTAYLIGDGPTPLVAGLAGLEAPREVGARRSPRRIWGLGGAILLVLAMVVVGGTVLLSGGEGETAPKAVVSRSVAPPAGTSVARQPANLPSVTTPGTKTLPALSLEQKAGCGVGVPPESPWTQGQLLACYIGLGILRQLTPTEEKACERAFGAPLSSDPRDGMFVPTASRIACVAQVSGYKPF